MEVKRDERARVVIDRVDPQVDGGRFAVKGVRGEHLHVRAVAVCDGHDQVASWLLYRWSPDDAWERVRMAPAAAAERDVFTARLPLDRLGRAQFTVEAAVDRYETWRRDVLKKAGAGKAARADLTHGARLLREGAANGDAGRKALLEGAAADLEAIDPTDTAALEARLDDAIGAIMAEQGPRPFVSHYEQVLEVMSEPKKARFTTWYELFPRSASPEPGRHGTFADVEARLPYVQELGFDTLYLPPIHPIGRTHRKGKNNSPVSDEGDVGSPWGIGAKEGGHDAIHPDLGTLDDFAQLVEAARERGIDIALDIAFQCSPDHPYVKAHPEWFRHREDGTIQCAENPPKVYEDIYPLDFESENWEGLWNELLRVVKVWVERGVTIFRVDNPHTKPFDFWEWLIRNVKDEHPEVIFLAEAFARPTVMYRLAKLGFSQSYNYFPWKNAKWELEQYYGEITKPPINRFFRPSSWPNTPDILTEYLQYSGRPGFAIREIVAATISASYGIYGPVFELAEGTAAKPGSEEYLDSEKYQVRHWNLDAPHSLKHLIARMNRIRREHPALQQDATLEFHRTDNEQIVAYSKVLGDDVVLVLANLDPHHRHSGWVDLSLDALGIDPHDTYLAYDLLGDGRFVWQGSRNYVELDPDETPAHVFALRRRARRENDFEYFL